MATALGHTWSSRRLRLLRIVTVITVTAVMATVTASGADASEKVARIAGNDRYETAAEISKATIQDPSQVKRVFVAVGTNFPDALAAAAVAGQMGVAPLLLVTSTSVPPATAAELARLDPEEIILMGGTAVISPAVETALGAYGTVIRIAGANRYETAVKLSEWAFPNPVEDVVIATGANFPDALTGGPIAALSEGPMLLVPQGSLPEVVRDELLRLNPEAAIVLGGEAAVSKAIADEIEALGIDVVRFAGVDRYDTAVELSFLFPPFQAPNLSFVAVGTNFPDALAGAAAAGRFGAPVFLTRTDSLPEVVADQLEFRKDDVLILGGTGAVSQAVMSQIAALIE